MFAAFPLALAQLRDPRILKVLVKSLLLTLLLFMAAALFAGWLLTGTDPCAILPFGRGCEIGAGEGMIAAILFGLFGLWFLFPAIATGVIGFFADDVVEAVEARHYPAARGRNLPAGRSLALGIRSAGRLLVWNLVAFPFYLLLLVTGVGPFLLFLAVNAVALGRDLGEMVGARHLTGEALETWLAATRLKRALLGLGTTGLFMIPVVNLLAPVLGAAMATHLFHRK